MRSSVEFTSPALSVVAFECHAGPRTPAVVEHHEDFSISFVRSGTFGYIVEGQLFDLVPGSVLIGRRGDEFVCTHEHSCGDDCLSFRLSDDLADATGLWRRPGPPPALAPRPELMILGELVQGAIDRRHDVSLEEAALVFTTRCAAAVSGDSDRRPRWTSAANRRKALAAAADIDEQPEGPFSLQSLAVDAGLSSYHFLRMFADVVGVTPHQYLIRSRLRRAARLLAEEERRVTDVAFDSGFSDLSNFVRTFRRAAGLSPQRYRRAARGDRKILQERIGPPALR